VLQPFSRTSVLAFAITLAALGSSGDAHAKKFQVLYSFSGGNDGAQPHGALIRDDEGNLYGTTEFGGASNRGTVFKLAPDGTETVLHSFTGGSGGDYPVAGLIRDAAGNLFGTTGGSDFGGSLGTVFRVAPDGTLTTLHSFQGPPDGALPFGDLVADKAGNLIGTTWEGGFDRCSAPAGCGTVFKVAPDGTETVLYAFCAQTNCTDGIYPYGGVTLDRKGNLYGTTLQGGSGCQVYEGCGTVFWLGLNGHEKALHSFGSGSDGSFPASGMTFDKSGNLYGTTVSGGSNPSCASCGIIFRIAPDGTENIVYSFDGAGSTPSWPDPGLRLDKAGNLYGTRENGGACASGCGTAFRVASDGTATILHEFCVRTNCVDGSAPYSGLVADDAGNFYGTTSQGGTNGTGTVFRLRK
jgi:uncharacterized repeat protein (TIGR03803 family)